MKQIALLINLILTFSVHAAPTSEQASLALLLTQLDQMQSTLARAEAQADGSPSARFYFDYTQASADLRTMRTGIHRYLSPLRAQPRNVTAMSGLYRKEARPDD
jgi:RAQPRD family integrative conjugative element protein